MVPQLLSRLRGTLGDVYKFPFNRIHALKSQIRIRKIHATPILSSFRRENSDSSTNFVRNSKSFVEVRIGFAKRFKLTFLLFYVERLRYTISWALLDKFR